MKDNVMTFLIAAASLVFGVGLGIALSMNPEPTVMVYPFAGVDYIIASTPGSVAIVPHFDPLP